MTDQAPGAWINPRRRAGEEPPGVPAVAVGAAPPGSPPVTDGERRQRRADILVNVMFGVFAAAWVAEFGELLRAHIPDFATPGAAWLFLKQTDISPHMEIGIWTFVNLASLWWWYTRIIDRYVVYEQEVMSILDIIIMVVFAIGYNWWNKSDGVFMFTFVLAMCLLLGRFIGSLVIICWNMNKILISNNNSYNSDITALGFGIGFLFLIIAGAGIHVATANSYADLPQILNKISPKGLLMLCFIGTGISGFAGLWVRHKWYPLRGFRRPFRRVRE